MQLMLHRYTIRCERVKNFRYRVWDIGVSVTGVGFGA
jgi:hypothetical protein